VQQQLLNRLSEMRYSPAATTRAPRPKKSEKLPPGASYTCSPTTSAAKGKQPAAKRKIVPASGDYSDSESSEDSSNSSSDESSDESGKERSRRVQNIIRRLAKKRSLPEEDENEQDDDCEAEVEKAAEEQESHIKQKGEKEKQKGEKEKQTGEENQQYLPGSYVAVIYEGDWYVGEVIDKNGEPEAEEGESYVFVNFMEHNQQGSKQGERLVWPKKLDMLNVLKEDILFTCQAPTPNPTTSTFRGVTYSLSKAEIIKAKQLFARFQAYYPTKIWLFLFYEVKKGKSDPDLCCHPDRDPVQCPGSRSGWPHEFGSVLNPMVSW
jgi:hypothetical protein